MEHAENAGGQIAPNMPASARPVCYPEVPARAIEHPCSFPLLTEGSPGYAPLGHREEVALGMLPRTQPH